MLIEHKENSALVDSSNVVCKHEMVVYNNFCWEGLEIGDQLHVYTGHGHARNIFFYLKISPSRPVKQEYSYEI